MKSPITLFKEFRRKHRVKRITNPSDSLEMILRFGFIAAIGACALALLWSSVTGP